MDDLSKKLSDIENNTLPKMTKEEILDKLERLLTCFHKAYDHLAEGVECRLVSKAGYRNFTDDLFKQIKEAMK